MSGCLATTCGTARHTCGDPEPGWSPRTHGRSGFQDIGSAIAEAGTSPKDIGGKALPARQFANCEILLDVAQCLSEERIASRLSKDDLIDMQGTVVAVHSGGLYRVQCDAGHEVLAQLSGRMRRFRIKVVPGDRVTVGVSPYDPVRGIITFRAR